MAALARTPKVPPIAFSRHPAPAEVSDQPHRASVQHPAKDGVAIFPKFRASCATVCACPSVSKEARTVPPDRAPKEEKVCDEASYKKRGRAQAAAVLIPSNPVLDRNAAAIKGLGQQSFDNLIEIGRLLIECRRILKGQRLWLAWIKAEFQWSRTDADRCISLYQNRDKVRNVRTLGLPVSALYLLARAPAKTIERLSQHLEAGEPPSVRDVALLTRSATITSDQPPGPRGYVYPPEPASPPKRVLTRAHMKMPQLQAQLTFIRNLEDIALKLQIMVDQEVGEAAALTAEDRRTIANYCAVIGDHAATIASSVERVRLTVVKPIDGNHDDGEGTRH